MLELLKEKDGSKGERDRALDDDSELEEHEHEPLVCKRCGAEISSRDALFCMDGETVSRVFSNPHGVLHEILTVLHVQGIVLEGPPTTEFTWFPGYAWEVAYCAQCRAHLGWEFSSMSGSSEPSRFWGLRRSEIAG